MTLAGIVNFCTESVAATPVAVYLAVSLAGAVLGDAARVWAGRLGVRGRWAKAAARDLGKWGAAGGDLEGRGWLRPFFIQPACSVPSRSTC